MAKKIYIDAGHGGSSVGASYNGRREQDDCLRLALAIKSILDMQEGVETRLSRYNNSNPSLSKRAKDANSWKADYFCSLHRNAISPNKARGVEAWCYSKIEIDGITFVKAENIVNALCEATGYANRGVKLGHPLGGNYAVNRLTNMSSCLLEVGFIDSEADNTIFDAYFPEIALAIAKSLMKNVGLEYKTPIIKGDVDGDGKVTSADARLILRAAVGLEKVSLETGDVNGDGKITSEDAREAMRRSVNL